MSHNYKWPTEKPIIVHNVLGTEVSLLKEKFGALSQSNDIYSRICVGNSVISLEPYRGCTLGCAYCMANNDIRGLRDSKSIQNAIIRSPEKIYDTIDLLKALINHPVFIPNHTVLGFCTGSTEVFLKNVNDNVWEAMKYMADIGLKNPIWLVVKSFGECDYKKWFYRFSYLSDRGVRTIISITDAGLPSTIEPYHPDNRFVYFKGLSNAGVVLSHHLRPILPDISTIDDLINTIDKSKNIVSSICYGGLRIDPGMRLFWQKYNGEQYEAGNQKKELDQALATTIKEYIVSIGLPVFEHSSEMISYHLGMEDYNLNRYRGNNGAFLQLGDKYTYIAKKACKGNLSSSLNEIALSIGLDVEFSVYDNGDVYLLKELKYTEYHALLQAIGHSYLFQEKSI